MMLGLTLGLNEGYKRNGMPLGKLFEYIISSDLITTVWRIREPQTDIENFHCRSSAKTYVIINKDLALPLSKWGDLGKSSD